MSLMLCTLLFCALFWVSIAYGILILRKLWKLTKKYNTLVGDYNKLTKEVSK